VVKRWRSSKFWPWIRDGGVALLLLLSFRAYQQRDVPKGAAPLLEGTDLDGNAVTLASYRGKPVLLHFWATWCGVCKVEQSNIDAVAKDFPVLSVAAQSGSPPEVAGYVSEHRIAPVVVVDQRGEWAQRFGVRSFPASFVIDANGEIRHVEIGYTTELGLRARLWLARL
jgi:thiol-disulfide isomerase/thioredoxin